MLTCTWIISTYRRTNHGEIFHAKDGKGGISALPSLWLSSIIQLLMQTVLLPMWSVQIIWDCDVSFFLFCTCACLCRIVLSVSFSLMVTYLERAYFLALLYVMFSYVFVTLTYSVLGQVWYLIVSIPHYYYISGQNYLPIITLHEGVALYFVKVKSFTQNFRQTYLLDLIKLCCKSKILASLGETCLFVYLIDYLHPINNLSVKRGWVFLGWTITKLG